MLILCGGISLKLWEQLANLRNFEHDRGNLF
jgi:hypothetical protein